MNCKTLLCLSIHLFLHNEVCEWRRSVRNILCRLNKALKKDMISVIVPTEFLTGWTKEALNMDKFKAWLKQGEYTAHFATHWPSFTVPRVLDVITLQPCVLANTVIDVKAMWIQHWDIFSGNISYRRLSDSHGSVIFTLLNITCVCFTDIILISWFKKLKNIFSVIASILAGIGVTYQKFCQTSHYTHQRPWFS